MPTSALEWLYGTQLFGIKLGLGNVNRMLRELGLPRTGQKFIHVAGTNGKGSTCAFMHAILRQAGRTAGLFTSPHLIHFGERIRDTERLISEQEIEAGITRIRAQVQGWDPHPTFFEITFVLALDWFARREVEWVVLETGMGGRLDATNAIMPAASVITPIGLDHMQFLGGTLEKIAAEKAGIIKPGVPVVTQTQVEEVLQVIRLAAGKQNAPLIVIDRPCELPLGLAGPHQQWNAALALAALEAAGLHLPAEILERGLRQVEWPARFQKLRPGLILDGAHNVDSARALAAAWREHFPGQRATVVFGAVEGKDIAAVFRELAPIVGTWHLTRFDSPRSLSADWLGHCLRGAAPGTAAIHTHASLTEALEAIRDCSPALITGSLYLAGEVLARAGQGGYQPSRQ